ncbi:hypothetical protein D1O30_03715 [Methylocystis hirsuta]|uniref:Uncharacterized protein n=1 Tax=Methylocystis hirsuta TaxID=369798 RepID=A0A3M9XM71_9HYPH|nr:hypothetical protein D1O30_03715 [Methylocystis hirsuta]
MAQGLAALGRIRSLKCLEDGAWYKRAFTRGQRRRFGVAGIFRRKARMRGPVDLYASHSQNWLGGRRRFSGHGRFGEKVWEALQVAFKPYPASISCARL